MSRTTARSEAQVLKRCAQLVRSVTPRYSETKGDRARAFYETMAASRLLTPADSSRLRKQPARVF